MELDGTVMKRNVMLTGGVALEDGEIEDDDMGDICGFSFI